MKLMTVDDSNIIRNKISRFARMQAIDEVVSAKNGVEAIHVFKREMPDVVTMDITMPEMDGIECISKIVKINPNVLILVISALADKATAIEALKQGAHGFLCKPFTETELNNALDELLGGILHG